MLQSGIFDELNMVFANGTCGLRIKPTTVSLCKGVEAVATFDQNFIEQPSRSVPQTLFQKAQDSIDLLEVSIWKQCFHRVYIIAQWPELVLYKLLQHQLF